MTNKKRLGWRISPSSGAGNYLGFSLALPLAIGMASPSGAQTGTSAGGDQLETITVTAQKREERAQDIPVSITALSGSNLADAGIRGTDDLGNAIPSLVFTGGLNGSAYIRGVGSVISTAGQQSSVAIYEDGVLLISPLQGSLAFNNVQRVEVLKGPQGTLFGRNANGGVISIVTPDPTQTANANFNIGYGNFNTLEGKFYGNVPISNTVSANVSLYYYNQMDGWGKNLTTGLDSYRERSLDVRTKLRWAPSDTTDVILTFDHSSAHNELTDGRFLPGTMGVLGTLPPAGFYNTSNDFPSYNETTVDAGSVRVSTDLGGVTFRSISSYTNVNTNWPFDSDAGPEPVIQGPIRQSASGFTQEFQFLSPADQQITWIAGMFYLNSTAAFSPIRLFGSEFGPATVDVFGRTGAESFATFGQSTWNFLPDTNLTVGVRYTWDTRTVDGHTDVDLVPGTESFQTASFREPTYKVSLDHHFTQSIMAYGSVSTGFNSGQFNTGNAAAPAVKPEKMRAYEIGMKSDWLGGTLEANVAGFWYDYKDLQVTVVENAVTVQTNAAAARIKGGEFELLARPITDLRVKLGVSYTDAKYTKYEDAQFYSPLATGGYTSFTGDASGNTLIGAPKLDATLFADYDLHTGFGVVTTSANLSHKGRIYWDYGNFISSAPTNILNASVRWVPSFADHWHIELWGRNLTDREYFQSEGVRLESASGAPGAPRTYGIRVGADF